MTLKLYMHPVSTVSRPVSLFIAEKKLPVTQQVVDLMTGEHHQPAYVAVNPNKAVPALEEGDFRISESSAILKYLAARFDAPEYPKDLKERAKVDSVMDWFNTGFSTRARLRGVRTSAKPGSACSTTTFWARTTTSPTTGYRLRTISACVF